MATVVNKVKETKIDLKANHSKLFAVILIRGFVKLPQKIKDTLTMLKLDKRNTCVIIKSSSANNGMLFKVKDYITWGEIDDETLDQLYKHRGIEFSRELQDSKKLYSYKCYEYKGKKYKPFFNLGSPKQGFGRKGVKVSFNAGGSLGYRGDKINKLIKNML